MADVGGWREHGLQEAKSCDSKNFIFFIILNRKS
jgi:hypothetical protein